MLRTNSKKYLQNIETYILNQIDGTDYGTPTETPAQKIKFLLNCYTSEFNHKHNVRRYPNEQERFSVWLAGLPSAISLPCYYDDILALAQDLQEAEFFTMKQQNAICENYFNFMSFHIMKVVNKHSNITWTN